MASVYDEELDDIIFEKVPLVLCIISRFEFNGFFAVVYCVIPHMWGLCSVPGKCDAS